MKILNFFTILLLLLAVTNQAHAFSPTTAVPQIEWIRGCTEPSSASEPRRAIGCTLNGLQTITIRGRYFGNNAGAVEVNLVLSKNYLRHSKSTSSFSWSCGSPTHNQIFPSMIITCQLPKIGDDIQTSLLDAIPADKPKPNQLSFHLVLKTSTGTTIFRNGVQFATGISGASDQMSDETERQQATLRNLMSNALDWKTLGVGGLSKEVKHLIRRVISTRASKTAVNLMKDLGLPHIKGVLLYGLPGCGKTLLARQIAKNLGATNVKVISGPSIVSKFVGESEKNLREAFEPAVSDWKRHGANSPLHVVILDEVDAILKTRHSNDESSSGATATYDGLTTTVLTVLDGLDSVGNLLVFALTNRKDTLDPALLRPGRFEVQLQLHLPNVKARKEILEIHAAKLESSKMLHADVDFFELAQLTPSFSGADLAGVVRSAVSFSFQRMGEKVKNEIESEKSGDQSSSSCSSSSSSSTPKCSSTSEKISSALSREKVTMADFLEGVAEIRATKGSIAADVPHRLLRRGLVPTAAHSPVLRRINKQLVTNFAQLPPKSFYRILLHGAPESGLTSIAASVCSNKMFDSVQILRAESILSSSAAASANSGSDKISDELLKAIQTAQEADHACLVIDGADQLANSGEYSRGSAGPSHYTVILKTLRRILQSPTSLDDDFAARHQRHIHQTGDAEEKRQLGKVLVVMTVQSLSFVRSLSGSTALFDSEEHVSLLGPHDVARVLTAYGIFDASTEWKKAESAAMLQLASDIPVKRLLKVVDMVRSKMAIGAENSDGIQDKNIVECRASPHPLLLKNSKKSVVKNNYNQNEEEVVLEGLDSVFYDGLTKNNQNSGLELKKNVDGESYDNERRLPLCGRVLPKISSVLDREKLLYETIREAALAYHVDV